MVESVDVAAVLPFDPEPACFVSIVEAANTEVAARPTIITPVKILLFILNLHSNFCLMLDLLPRSPAVHILLSNPESVLCKARAAKPSGEGRIESGNF